mgnify:CR=1 FL=1
MQVSEELSIQQIELEEAFKREVEQIRRLSISKEKEKGKSLLLKHAIIRLKIYTSSLPVGMAIHLTVGPFPKQLQ